MSISVILHVAGDEPVLGEVDELPEPGDYLFKILHPRRMDGKDLSFLVDNVSIVYWPAHRVNFLEVLPSREEEEIIGFVRE
jgi:hypothetical protein